MEKATVLIVDDTPENIDILVGILGSDYKIKVAIDGPKALALAQKSSPDLILLDVMMPGMNGYEVCQKLKNEPLTCHIPVIFVTALSDTEDETKGFALGAVDYITKPVSPAVVKARVKTHLSLYDQKRLLESEVEHRTKELKETRFEIIRRLGRAAEYKDNETGLHVVRMSHYARLLAMAAGHSSRFCELLYNAAPMHDIGKIGTPDAILKKPGKLDADEWKEMQAHAAIGAEIIGEHDDPLLQMAKRIAISHHEKWDGSGYPYGLVGEDIPIEGRIIAIADVFDALTSARPYKKAWTVEDTLSLIEKESGKHFDPELVEKFKSVMDDVKLIKAEHEESF
ncbi:two-component system response regulator [Shewanella sp. 1_MG-2023]|uniref:Two-component system response regulator n=1 Tax=Shewanella electrodiphila TaxID=934143 RepID=A0ABT0KRY8_9GAMM|nr:MULTISPECIES: two-component system response regulator [Shewanella]MCL1046611.1 two-component system response regulator [Shewanella electrodiphila]MDO6611097.1 two-component system response regulator [Shewanella sp. 7_MG-2023]MDO6771026.1 two-component system response regulator [Shewanella sp. 2_MG-2023]MDO6795628.1 two-component system response regulator [Shewanella sp. 1_MG-2023]PMG79319.1 two-component system response regulator [Shewanella sp. 10N.286.51.B7]